MRRMRAVSALGLEEIPEFSRGALGWQEAGFPGLARPGEYGTPTGGRNAFVRFPSRRAANIILTDDDRVDARAIADRLAGRMFARRRPFPIRTTPCVA